MKQRNRFKLIQTTVRSFCYILNCLSINNSSRNSDYNFYFQKENLFERLFASFNNLYVHMYTQFSFQFNLKIKEVITINISFYRDWFKKNRRSQNSEIFDSNRASQKGENHGEKSLIDWLRNSIDPTDASSFYRPCSPHSPFPFSFFKGRRKKEKEGSSSSLFLHKYPTCVHESRAYTYTCMCIYIYARVHLHTVREGAQGGGNGGRQALLGEPYRRFLGERVEASLGFGSTTRTACRAGRGRGGKSWWNGQDREEGVDSKGDATIRRGASRRDASVPPLPATTIRRLCHPWKVPPFCFPLSPSSISPFPAIATVFLPPPFFSLLSFTFSL